MAAANTHLHGIGGTSGDDLVKLPHLLTTGDVWYVHYGTGVDAASLGKDRQRPLKTLAQAYTNAVAGDAIVFLAGHFETLTAVQTLAKAGMALVSEGTGTARARFTRNVNAVLFDITAADLLLGNVYFVQGSLAAASATIKVAAAGVEIRGCYMELGVADDAAGIEFVTGAERCLVKDTTLISVSPASTDQPHGALKVTNAMTRLDIENVVIDGATSGWAQPFAVNCAAAITRLRGSSVYLMNGSDLTVATGSSGWFGTADPSGGARVVWAA